ncbi:hypothetical protein M758_7G105000 [Ceratodon purpureus]|nr:hypothetical protein M758_7G105000 [Ceratodon purpureus]
MHCSPGDRILKSKSIRFFFSNTAFYSICLKLGISFEHKHIPAPQCVPAFWQFYKAGTSAGLVWMHRVGQPESERQVHYYIAGLVHVSYLNPSKIRGPPKFSGIVQLHN